MNDDVDHNEKYFETESEWWSDLFLIIEQNALDDQLRVMREEERLGQLSVGLRERSERTEEGRPVERNLHLQIFQNHSDEIKTLRVEPEQ